MDYYSVDTVARARGYLKTSRVSSSSCSYIQHAAILFSSRLSSPPRGRFGVSIASGNLLATSERHASRLSVRARANFPRLSSVVFTSSHELHLRRQSRSRALAFVPTISILTEGSHRSHLALSRGVILSLFTLDVNRFASRFTSLTLDFLDRLSTTAIDRGYASLVERFSLGVVVNFAGDLDRVSRHLFPTAFYHPGHVVYMRNMRKKSRSGRWRFKFTQADAKGLERTSLFPRQVSRVVLLNFEPKEETISARKILREYVEV